jgi:hypothetical protein
MPVHMMTYFRKQQFSSLLSSQPQTSHAIWNVIKTLNGSHCNKIFPYKSLYNFMILKKGFEKMCCIVILVKEGQMINN